MLNDDNTSPQSYEEAKNRAIYDAKNNINPDTSNWSLTAKETYSQQKALSYAEMIRKTNRLTYLIIFFTSALMLARKILM